MLVVRGGAPDERIHNGEVCRIADRVALLIGLGDDVRVADPIGGHARERGNRGVVEAAVAGDFSGWVGLGETPDVRGDDEFGVIVASELHVLERGCALVVAAGAPVVEVGFKAAGDAADTGAAGDVETHLRAGGGAGAELVDRRHGLAADAGVEGAAREAEVDRRDLDLRGGDCGGECAERDG